MRVLVAGASGVLGRQLLPALRAAGHDPIGLSRSAHDVAGAEWIAADLLDAESVAAAVSGAAPDAVVHLASALPDPIDPARIDREMAATDRLRTVGTANLLAAALQAGTKRVIAQSIAYAYDPAGPDVCDEDQPLWVAPPKRYAHSVAAVRELESEVAAFGGVVLRFGHLYGPGTSYAPDGGLVGQVRRGSVPIVGKGGAVFSFVHAADAAQAVVAALASDYAGVLNVVDDDPAPVREWLPELTRLAGARTPRHVPAWLARFAVGPFGVAFMTALRGASNERAGKEISWRPVRASWRAGLAAEFAPAATP